MSQVQRAGKKKRLLEEASLCREREVKPQTEVGKQEHHNSPTRIERWARVQKWRECEIRGEE